MKKIILSMLVCLALPVVAAATEVVINGEAVVISNHRSENYLYMFTATWCGPCKQMKPIVHKLAADGYKVLILDVDECKKRNIDLSAYAVKSIPTITVNKPAGVNDKNQELFLEVKRFVGVTSEKDIKAALDRDWNNEQ